MNCILANQKPKETWLVQSLFTAIVYIFFFGRKPLNCTENERDYECGPPKKRQK